MCLIFFAWKSHPGYPLIFAGNRDEFYERPTAPLSFWEDESRILAGRDLKGSGTWLGITRSGRIAAVTNYRDPSSVKKNAPSRGLLLTRYLTGQDQAEDFLKEIQKNGSQYNGFNLLVGSPNELWYYSNRGDRIQKLGPGEYGLSNHLLDTPWPKVKRGKRNFKNVINKHKEPEIEEIFKLLQDRTPAPDQDLPDTGVGLAWERILSPVFITSPHYGTRSSSIILVKQDGQVTFLERTFDPETSETDLPRTCEFQFNLRIEGGSF